MTKAELDYILGTMLDSHKNVSDLNITVDKPFQVESSGELVSVGIEPPVDKLTPFQAETIALNILNRNRRLAKDFEASIASAKAWLIIASVQLLTRRVAYSGYNHSDS